MFFGGEESEELILLVEILEAVIDPQVSFVGVPPAGRVLAPYSGFLGVIADVGPLFQVTSRTGCGK